MPTPLRHAQLVDSQAALDACCPALARQRDLPLDTEFARTDTYRPRLCLLQIATPAAMLCIDTLAALDTAALWRILAAEGALKIMHAAKQDLEVFALHFGALPGPVFDTQIAAALLGHPAQAGYATLVEAELGVRLEKTQTRTDWTRRPLTEAQLAYAADDVAWLLPLAERLRERLQAQGREAWASADSAALLDPSLYAVRPEEAWERLSGIEYQPPAVQARARRLAAWRERRAADADRPRQWILADAALMALATAAPADLAGIEALGQLPPGVVRRSGTALLEELRQADADLACGAITPTQRSRPAATDNGQVKRLAAIVQKQAAELGIAPELLATRAELTALLRGVQTLRPLQGWRRDVIGAALLAAL
jgi:ribonuclease D